MAKDFYSILGISKETSPDDIRRAYRNLSKKWHPDKHKGEKEAEQKFKEINEAYEVLSDPEKKRMYDQFGTTGGSGEGSGSPFGGFDFSGFTSGGFGNFSDIFEGDFGGDGRQSRARQRTTPRELLLEIDFMESVTGVKKTFSLTRWRTCAACDGKGSLKGEELITCSDCGGTGQVVRTAQSLFGVIQQSVFCSVCNGSGKVPRVSCSECKGEGRVQKREEVTVNIPAGIADGQTLRLRGEGDSAPRTQGSDDLFVTVRVEKDRRFKRDGDDIRSSTTLSVLDVLLGTEKPIETVHGTVELKVPAGTQPGQVFRLKGKGMPILGTIRHGDQYVTVHVDIPKKLSRAERKLIEEWKDQTS